MAADPGTGELMSIHCAAAQFISVSGGACTEARPQRDLHTERGKKGALIMERTPTGKTAAKDAKPLTFDVLPHEGDGQEWDLHQQRARKHDYFHTQKEAVEAARVLAAGKAAHIVLHARDGHTYREFDTTT
jgi:hypothetical protein